jgi:hypothetical protein
MWRSGARSRRNLAEGLAVADLASCAPDADRSSDEMVLGALKLIG